MYSDILIPVDLGQSTSWKRALPFAVDLARHYDARLHVLTVVPDYGFHYVSQFFPDGYEARVLAEAQHRLQTLVDENVPGGIEVQRIVAHGSIYREIVAAAERVGADVIIMASHTPDVSDFIIGPNAERVLRSYGRSVFIVRD